MTTRTRAGRRRVPFRALGMLALVAGCDPSATKTTSPGEETVVAPPESMPERVTLAAQRMTAGFSSGRLRQQRHLPAFHIAKYPTTVRDYRACVEAGACKKPPEAACARIGSRVLDGPNYQREDVEENMPITCAGIDNAKSYCEWMGGTLPHLEQWLLAARGKEVARTAWGDSPPNCQQHSAASYGADGALCPPEKTPFQVGQHPEGASTYGVEDVLLTRGELLAPSDEALFAACGTNVDACVVYGMLPGAIDAAEGVASIGEALKAMDGGSEDSTEPTEVATKTPYGFRCLWEDVQ